MTAPLEVRELRSRIVRWHRRHAPIRGWESDRNPYRVLVREVMSQQTQIDRVVDHHRRFCERFPSITALADATTADVIRQWRGLGYNRRAVALHTAARRIRDEHAGIVPDSLDALLALPGIGPYTAAAIAVGAFGARVPVVDTNIARALHRALGPRIDPAAVMAELVATSRDPRLATQAVMDFGAKVCASKPRCEQCPLQRVCAERSNPAPSPQRAALEAFEGSRRQVRGRLLDVLRDAPDGLSPAEALSRAGAHDVSLLDALVRDGLIERRDGRVELPS